MKKGGKALIVLGIVVIILALAVFFVFYNLDSIVKGAIEKYGSRATGTNVKVHSLHISLKNGEGTMGGLSIGNPSGFSGPTCLNVKDIAIDLDTGTVTGNPLVINKIRVTAPHFTYEINKSGEANINQIRNNVDRYAEPGMTSSEDAQGKKKIVVRSLSIEEGEIDVVVAALPDKSLSVKLPPLHLTNVGGAGGSTPGDLARQIIKPLLNLAIQSASRAGVGQYIGKNADEIKKMMENRINKELGTTGQEAAGKAKGALDKLIGK